jgi:acyl-CoA synthetase (NDP forming)
LGACEGAFPANCLDVGGGATAEKVTTAFKIILKDAAVEAILVNIFGGIMKCDTIATGVLTAVRDVGLDRPLVVRLEGTNVAQGKKLIADSGLPVIAADGLKDGCMKAAQAANAYRIGRGLPPHPALPTPPAIAYIPRRRPALAKARSQAGPAKAAKPAKTHKPAKRATAPARRARSATRPASGKAKRPGKRR